MWCNLLLELCYFQVKCISWVSFKFYGNISSKILEQLETFWISFIVFEENSIKDFTEISSKCFKGTFFRAWEKL